MIYLNLITCFFVALGLSYIMALIYAAHLENEMKKMKKRTLILNMIDQIKNQREGHAVGFCWTFIRCKNINVFTLKYPDYEIEMLKEIPELKKYKPKKKFDEGGFWFHPLDKSIRIYILESILQEME
jgi:hypothetical protein